MLVTRKKLVHIASEHFTLCLCFSLFIYFCILFLFCKFVLVILIMYFWLFILKDVNNGKTSKNAKKIMFLFISRTAIFTFD